MTAPANVVVSARQNGPMMGQRGIIAHQAHRVGIGFGTIVGVGVLDGDGGGWLGLVGLGGVLGGGFGFGIVPNYRGAGTAASTASTAAATATTTAAISTSATAGHCLYCIYVLACRVESQLVLLWRPVVYVSWPLVFVRGACVICSLWSPVCLIPLPFFRLLSNTESFASEAGKARCQWRQ